MNIELPLITGFWVPRPGLPKVWVSVKYEKLQIFCYGYGRIGHDMKSCRAEKLMERRFGPEMCTAPVRVMTRVIWIDDQRTGSGDESSHRSGEGGSANVERVEGRRVEQAREVYAGTDTVGSGREARRHQTNSGETRVITQSLTLLERGGISAEPSCVKEKGKQVDLGAKYDIGPGPNQESSQATQESTQLKTHGVGLRIGPVYGPARSQTCSASTGSTTNNQYIVEMPSEDDVSGDGKAIVAFIEPLIPTTLINQLNKVSLKRCAEDSLTLRRYKKPNRGLGSLSEEQRDTDFVSDCTSPPFFDPAKASEERRVVKVKKGRKGVCRKLDVANLVEVPIKVGSTNPVYDDFEFNTVVPSGGSGGCPKQLQGPHELYILELSRFGGGLD